MINSILRPLSFSFVTLASVAILTAAEPGPTSDRTAPPADSTRVGCAAPMEIDLGWDEQIQLVEKRQAEKEAAGLAVPGAIVTPPFEAFAPYRTDLPPALSAASISKNSKNTKPHSPDQRSRE